MIDYTSVLKTTHNCLLDYTYVTFNVNRSGGGGTLIFSHIRRLGPIFGVQNSEFQYFYGVFRKMNIFWGIKVLWMFFWGHHKIGLV